MFMSLFKKFERRRNKRCWAGIDADCALMPGEEDASCKSYIRDMSKSGFCIDVFENIKRKKHIIVDVAIKGINTTLSLSGKIMWIKNYDDFARCGVQLEWLSDKNKYVDYVKRLEFIDRVR